MLGLATWQKHSMDDSIIKKIYSAERVDEDDSDSDDEGKQVDGNKLLDDANKDADTEALEDKKLQDAIIERERFSYSFKRFYYLYRFDSPLCCCCRAKVKRQDWL